MADGPIEDLKRLATAQGRPPSKADFAIIQAKYADRLRQDRKLQAEMWNSLCELQSPGITIDELRELFIAKRQSIDDIIMTVTLTREIPGIKTKNPSKSVPAASPTSNGVYSFAQKGEKLFLSTPARGNVHVTRAYDGKVQRRFRDMGFPYNTPFKKGVRPNSAVITEFSRPSDYFLPDCNPLCSAMLVDSVSMLGGKRTYYDFVAFTNAVHFPPALIAAGGTTPGDLLVSYASLEARLAPQYNYAVTGFVSYYESDIGFTRPKYVREMSDFIDCGNGLYLPTRSSETSYTETGSIESKTTIDLKVAKVNSGIDDSIFVGIIPPGTFVQDIRNNIIYVAGEKGSIESMISGSVKRSTPRGVFLVGIIVINICVFLAIVFAARSRIWPLIWKRGA